MSSTWLEAREENPPASANTSAMIRIAILLSGRHGRGSNMQAIAQACADGKIDGQVVSVLGNFSDSPALARAAGLAKCRPTRVVTPP